MHAAQRNKRVATVSTAHKMSEQNRVELRLLAKQRQEDHSLGDRYLRLSAIHSEFYDSCVKANSARGLLSCPGATWIIIRGRTVCSARASFGQWNKEKGITPSRERLGCVNSVAVCFGQAAKWRPAWHTHGRRIPHSPLAYLPQYADVLSSACSTLIPIRAGHCGGLAHGPLP